MFLLGTVKIMYLLKCCIIVNCMYLIIAQGSWRKAQGVFVSHTAHGARRLCFAARGHSVGISLKSV